MMVVKRWQYSCIYGDWGVKTRRSEWRGRFWSGIQFLCACIHSISSNGNLRINDRWLCNIGSNAVSMYLYLLESQFFNDTVDFTLWLTDFLDYSRTITTSNRFFFMIKRLIKMENNLSCIIIIFT